MSQFIAIAKVDYVALSGSDEEVIPGNIGALKKGLEALLSEDARDNARADQLWAEAFDLLAKDQDDELGAGAEGKIQVSNDLSMDEVGWTL